MDRPDGGTAAADAGEACNATIFQDREESEFYAQCVRDFFFGMVMSCWKIKK